MLSKMFKFFNYICLFIIVCVCVCLTLRVQPEELASPTFWGLATGLSLSGLVVFLFAEPSAGQWKMISQW